MSKKEKNTGKKRQVRNKARDMIADYYNTNREYDRENRRRQEEEGVKTKGLRNLQSLSLIHI